MNFHEVIYKYEVKNEKKCKKLFKQIVFNASELIIM
jgi:hypothetical protein